MDFGEQLQRDYCYMAQYLMGLEVIHRSMRLDTVNTWSCCFRTKRWSIIWSHAQHEIYVRIASDISNILYFNVVYALRDDASQSRSRRR